MEVAKGRQKFAAACTATQQDAWLLCSWASKTLYLGVVVGMQVFTTQHPGNGHSCLLLQNT